VLRWIGYSAAFVVIASLMDRAAHARPGIMVLNWIRLIDMMAFTVLFLAATIGLVPGDAFGLLYWLLLFYTVAYHAYAIHKMLDCSLAEGSALAALDVAIGLLLAQLLSS
jgi:hypothetical protein